MYAWPLLRAGSLHGRGAHQTQGLHPTPDGLASSALLAMLTHYHSTGPLLGVAAHAIVGLRGHVRRKVLLALVAAAGAWFVVLGPFVLTQRGDLESTARWQRSAAPNRAEHLFLQLLRQPARVLVQAAPPQPAPGLALSLAVAVATLGAARERRLSLWAWVAAATSRCSRSPIWPSAPSSSHRSLHGHGGARRVRAGGIGGRRGWGCAPSSRPACAGACAWSLLFGEPVVHPWREYSALFDSFATEQCLLVFQGSRPYSPALMAVLHYLFPAAGPVLVTERGPGPSGRALPETDSCLVVVEDHRGRAAADELCRTGRRRPHASTGEGCRPWRGWRGDVRRARHPDSAS